MNLIILTEGTKTEVIYFKALIEHFDCAEISVQPGKSPDPIRLLREAMQLKQKYNCEAWVVLDAEVSGQDRTRDRRLKKALTDGARFGIHFAVSEPCFEAWLLSHFDSPKNYNLIKNSKFYADLLSNKLGTPFSKKNYNTAPFLETENLQSAIGSLAGKHGLAELIGKIMSEDNKD